MNKKKNILLKGICIGTLQIVIYVTILMIGQAIPKEWVFGNVEKSCEQLDKLGLYYDVVEGAQWDNWTDTYFLNAAITQYEGNLLEKALANSYTTSMNTGRKVLDDLSAAIHPEEKSGLASYSRYWAGNLTLYKFLLIFMPISGIRNTLLIVTVILLAFAIINIYKILGYRGVIPLLCSILACKYIPLSMCLTFSSDIILTLSVVNFCAVKIQKGNVNWKKYYALFAIIGSVCVYMGYWAFPLITLGIPLVFITVLRMKSKDSEKDIIVDNVWMSVFWGIGLCGTVIVKQILCYFVLGSQTGTSALSQRLGAGYSLLDRVVSMYNVVLRALSDNTVMIVLVITLLLAAYYLNQKRIENKYGFAALIFISIYPIVWCLVLAQHNMHGFVVYMYGVTYYALLSLVFSRIENLKVSCDNHKKTVTVLCVWLLVSCLISQIPIYYNNQKQEPWSTEEMDRISLVDTDTVAQHIIFDTEKPIHLKYLKVMIENMSEESEGVLHVVLTDNGQVVHKNDISLNKIKNESVWDKYQGDSLIGRVARKLANNSRWTKIEMDCMIYPGHDYIAMYSVEDVQTGDVNILTQSISQGAPANEDLYVNDSMADVTLVNIFYFNSPISVQARVYLMAISLLLIQGIMKVISSRYQKLRNSIME